MFRRLVDLLEQRLAAAVVVPGQHHVRVHAEGRARAPQRQRRVLAVVVGHHAVAAVERALVHRVEQLEGRHHRAGGQHLDLQPAAGHVVDLLGEVGGVLVEDVLGRPGALEAQADGLRASTTIGAASAPAATAPVAAFEEAAARRRASGSVLLMLSPADRGWRWTDPHAGRPRNRLTIESAFPARQVERYPGDFISGPRQLVAARVSRSLVRRASTCTSSRTRSATSGRPKVMPKSLRRSSASKSPPQTSRRDAACAPAARSAARAARAAGRCRAA